MKQRLLCFCAYFLMALAALAALASLIVVAIIGLGMKSAVAGIVVILAGFILTAISATILVAVAQILLLFVRVEEKLSNLAARLEPKTGD